MENEILESVEQDSINFYGQQIITVALEDGRRGVVLRWICEGMGLDIQAQVRRCRRNPTLAPDLLTVRLNTDGGRQAMPSLLLNAVPFWLATIDASRIDDEDRRATVIRYQRECMDVLYQHFADRAQRAIIPSQALPQPQQPAPDAEHDIWIAYHQEMAEWHRWQRDIEAFRTRTEADITDLRRRMEHQENLTLLVPELIAERRNKPLSDAHQATVRSAVNRLADLTKRSHAAIYDELKFTFRVSKYDRIPDGQWPQVIAWLVDRIHKAGGRTDDLENEQGSLF